MRELNDEINKLNKTKSYWDQRVTELGGGDTGKGRKFYDVEGTVYPVSTVNCLFVFLADQTMTSHG